jgi:hypothetical protein
VARGVLCCVRYLIRPARAGVPVAAWHVARRRREDGKVERNAVVAAAGVRGHVM